MNARRVGLVPRALDKLLDLVGRPLAWGSFAILQLRERLIPGGWHVGEHEEDRDE